MTEELEEKKSEVKLIFLIVLSFWIAGVISSYFFHISVEMPLSFDIVTNTVLLTLGVFILSILFFGYLSPVIFFIVGVMQSPLIVENPLSTLLAIPLFFAGLSGTRVGLYLFKDLKGEDNLFQHKKKIITFIVVSIVLAVVIPLLLLFVEQFLPTFL